MVQCIALVDGYEMRKTIALLLLLLAFPVHVSAQKQDVEMIAMSFFDAIKAGNVGQIRALVDGPLLESVRVLLTENKQYPDYLRERYLGATAEITNISMLPDGDALVDMAVTFESNISYMQLRMSQHKGGRWRVVEQSQVY
jgi:hypothetical protein